MHDYSQMKIKYGNPVSQTIDSPIMILDYFELQDAFAAVGIVLVFGVLFYEWFLMILLLVIVMGFGPAIRRRNEKGIFIHWPYRKFGMSLPGLLNPKGKKSFSD